MTLIKKYYELEKWDKARHWDDVHTFSHMNGSYAKWHNENSQPVTGHHEFYQLGDDWIYFPYTQMR